MKNKINLLLMLLMVSLSFSADAQVLLYQWAFTNSADTQSNSAASYAITPGTGNLLLQNVSGNVFGTTGADGLNPDVYFTNSNVGPGSGPGVDATGAEVANGQSYNGGPSATAIATNLNLGNVNQLTVTFWMQMGATVGAQFPRFVQFYQTTAYDVGGKGSGNHSGVGASLNGWSGTAASQVQNGIANASAGQQTAITITGNPNFAAGYQADGATWYFEAITYDGTAAANNFTSWIGQLGTSVQPFTLSANYSYINFTTNATVMIGGNDQAGTPRALSLGAIADVRFYSGVLTSNMLENIRKFLPDGVIPPGSQAAYVTVPPASGSTFTGGSRTFSMDAGGNPAVFSYLWRSNGVPISGATNSTLVLTNIQNSANGAAFTCSVTNYLMVGGILGGTNSVAATLTVVQPAAGSYAKAVFANKPYSFWLVNEPSNAAAITIFDYANGHDGMALIPANMLFVGGPAQPSYPGFPTSNSAIQSVANKASQLNMANPGNFPNTGMTICGWVNMPVVANGNGLIFDLVSDTAGGFGLNFGAGNVINYQWGAANSYSSGLTANTAEWTFVALVVTTNLTPDDISSFITADTNAIIYMGSHSLGLQSASDSTAASGDAIPSGTSASPLALGRTTVGFSENGGWSAVNNVQFNAVAVFYSALSPQTITNLYLSGAGLYLAGNPDPNTVGNLLLTYPMGTLQESTDLKAGFHDVSGAPTSPDSVPTSDPQHYYRIRN